MEERKVKIRCWRLFYDRSSSLSSSSLFFPLPNSSHSIHHHHLVTDCISSSSSLLSTYVVLSLLIFIFPIFFKIIFYFFAPVRHYTNTHSSPYILLLLRINILYIAMASGDWLLCSISLFLKSPIIIIIHSFIWLAEFNFFPVRSFVRSMCPCCFFLESLNLYGKKSIHW